MIICNRYIPFLLMLILMAGSCKKMSFNHRLKGYYNGTWETRFEISGYPQVRTFPDNIAVGDYNKRTFTITSTSDMTDGKYYGTRAFEYSTSNEYTYEKSWHTGIVDKYKAVFNPKEDSLIIYTSEGPVFRGRKQ